MRYSILIFFGIVLFSCSNSEKRSEHSADKPDRRALLLQLLEQAPGIDLPFRWDFDSKPKTFRPEDFEDLIPNLSTIGYFKVHEFYAFLQFIPADESLPQLTIIDSLGNKIDQRQIIIGKCHGDCSYECNESVVISEQFDIYAWFTSIYQDCDGSGDITPELAEASQQEAIGKIERNGRVSFKENEELTYKPDSAEVFTLGYHSEVFYYPDQPTEVLVKIKQINDSVITYWIDGQDKPCNSHYGTAQKVCVHCDGEIDEYQGTAYPSHEYFPVGKKNGVIGSIRIAFDKTKVVVKSNPNNQTDDCMRIFGDVGLNKGKYAALTPQLR